MADDQAEAFTDALCVEQHAKQCSISNLPGGEMAIQRAMGDIFDPLEAARLMLNWSSKTGIVCDVERACAHGAYFMRTH